MARREIGVRYDIREITARIERRRKAMGLIVKALCDVIGMSDYNYSRKKDMEVRWSLEEISAIADALKAPTGWPFISEQEGEFLDTHLYQRKPNA